MKYKIILSKQVQKFLDILTDDYLRIFKTKTDILAENPYARNSNLDISPLKGKPKGFYHIRIGDYRFLYEIQMETVIIYFYKADNRGDVYK